MCFGICAVTDVTVTYNSIVPSTDPPQAGDPILTFVRETEGNKIKIYSLEDIPWTEKSIEIDSPVVFRMDSSLNLEIPAIELQTGNYIFHEESGYLKYRGKKIKYYGNFTGDITHVN